VRVLVVDPSEVFRVGLRAVLAAEADVNAACAAARKAFDEGPWPTTPPAELAKVLPVHVLNEDGHGSTALVAEGSRIVKVFYPVFPPDRNAEEVLAWMSSR